MSYLSHRCPQTASKLQKVPLHSQGQYAQCPSVPQYIGYQVSADGQSFRPVYLTAEAYEAYLLSQQQEYQRRYAAFNLPPEHNEAQRNPPADPQQEAYPMQPTIQQFQPYYEHPRSVPEQVVQPDYQYPGQQDQAMSRRHTWNHDWNRLSGSDHYQASRSSQDLTSDPTNFDSNSHMTFPRYAAEPHACSDTDEMHPSCAFPTDGIGRDNTMFSQRGHGSISPEDIGQETVAIASLSEWSNGAEPMRNHSHVDPNSLSLTPKDIDRQHSHEGTATLGCESNSAEMRRGRQRAISSRKCSVATVETRTLSSHPARRRQSLSEHSESKASDDDSTVLSDVDLEAEGITFSPMSMTSIRIEGGKHISTSPRPDRVRGETDQSDSDLEALPEDSDSDYSPVVELRHRRKVAVSQHGPNAQPKRGRVPTKQKERLMLSSPECENVKAQQELCAGNVPVLGRYSPAPMEYSEDTDASTSGRPKKRKRCRRPGEVFKAFVCDVKNCDKRFRRSEHLRRHIRSLHTGEKPFRCEVCLKTFSRSDNLAQHMKVHRGAAKRSFSNASQTVVTTTMTTTSTAANVKARRRRSSPVRP